jgi:hypothetical protein
MSDPREPTKEDRIYAARVTGTYHHESIKSWIETGVQTEGTPSEDQETTYELADRFARVRLEGRAAGFHVGYEDALHNVEGAIASSYCWPGDWREHELDPVRCAKGIIEEACKEMPDAETATAWVWRFEMNEELFAADERGFRRGAKVCGAVLGDMFHGTEHETLCELPREHTGLHEKTDVNARSTVSWGSWGITEVAPQVIPEVIPEVVSKKREPCDCDQGWVRRYLPDREERCRKCNPLRHRVDEFGPDSNGRCTACLSRAASERRIPDRKIPCPAHGHMGDGARCRQCETRPAVGEPPIGLDGLCAECWKKGR